MGEEGCRYLSGGRGVGQGQGDVGPREGSSKTGEIAGCLYANESDPVESEKSDFMGPKETEAGDVTGESSLQRGGGRSFHRCPHQWFTAMGGKTCRWMSGCVGWWGFKEVFF